MYNIYMINYIHTFYYDLLKENILCKHKLKIVIYLTKKIFFTLYIINNYIILIKKIFK